MNANEAFGYSQNSRNVLAGLADRAPYQAFALTRRDPRLIVRRGSACDRAGLGVYRVCENLKIADESHSGVSPVRIAKVACNVKKSEFAFGTPDRDGQTLPANAEFNRFTEQLLHARRFAIVSCPIYRQQVGVTDRQAGINVEIVGLEITAHPVLGIGRQGQRLNRLLAG